MNKKYLILLVLSVVFMFGFVACDSDADVASRNISTAADNFEVQRRIVFYNGITGDYVLAVEGKCSLGNTDTNLRMSVTCKIGDGEFDKHFLGLSDNVFFVAEQLADEYRTKPETVLPNIDIETSITD